MTKPSALDNAHHAQFAWARFRMILGAMAIAGLLLSAVAVGVLWALNGPMPWPFIVMIVGGVWGTFMMAALLMGLMFLSSGTGHDESIEDLAAPELPDDD